MSSYRPHLNPMRRAPSCFECLLKRNLPFQCEYVARIMFCVEKYGVLIYTYEGIFKKNYGLWGHSLIIRICL